MITLDTRKVVHFRGSLKDKTAVVDFIKFTISSSDSLRKLIFCSEYEPDMTDYIKKNLYFEFSIELDAGTYDFKIFAADKAFLDLYSEEDFNVSFSFSEIKNEAA